MLAKGQRTAGRDERSGEGRRPYRLGTDPELRDPSADGAAVDQDLRRRNRELETPRTRAPRIEIEHAASLGGGRLVRVPGNNHAKAGGPRIEIQLRDVVDHVD